MAILPVGATEQHGPHLPLATDTLDIEAAALRVAEKLDAYCLPALPFSISHMHRGNRGTVYLRNSTLAAVVRDIASCVRQDGFKQFVILNGHGGNFILTSVVQDLNMDFPDLLTITVDFWNGVRESGIFGELDPLMHGDEFEVSVMLYLRKELVRKSKLRDATWRIDRELLRYFPIRKLAPSGFVGKPTRGNAKLGRKAFEFMVETSVRSIRETIRKVERVRSGSPRKQRA
jgi:creatinine amidohydrolase